MSNTKHRQNKLTIGVSYEGNSDIEVLSTLVERIVSNNGFAIKKIVPLKSSTGIIGFVKIHARKFFELTKDIDLAVFVTDKDRNTGDLVKKIEKILYETIGNKSGFCVVGVPDPHIESWLFIDEDCAKKIFKIDGTLKLPYKSVHPKSRFNMLYNEIRDGKKTQFQTRKELAKNMDFNICTKKSKDFSKFYTKFTNLLKNKIN